MLITYKQDLQIAFFFYFIYLLNYFSKGKSASEIEQTSQPAGIDK